jgi:hypothetical protein
MFLKTDSIIAKSILLSNTFIKHLRVNILFFKHLLK